MTEKRFTMCYEQNDINGWTMSIVDWQTKQPFDYTTYEVHSESITDTKDEMEDLCLLLNELNDENEQLKIKLEDIALENENTKESNDDAQYELYKLKKENEQLKQQRKDLLRLIDNNIELYENINTNVEFHKGEIQGKLTLLYNLRKVILND